MRVCLHTTRTVLRPSDEGVDALAFHVFGVDRNSYDTKQVTRTNSTLAVCSNIALASLCIENRSRVVRNISNSQTTRRPVHCQEMAIHGTAAMSLKK